MIKIPKNRFKGKLQQIIILFWIKPIYGPWKNSGAYVQ